MQFIPGTRFLGIQKFPCSLCGNVGDYCVIEIPQHPPATKATRHALAMPNSGDMVWDRFCFCNRCSGKVEKFQSMRADWWRRRDEFIKSAGQAFDNACPPPSIDDSDWWGWTLKPWDNEP